MFDGSVAWCSGGCDEVEQPKTKDTLLRIKHRRLVLYTMFPSMLSMAGDNVIKTCRGQVKHKECSVRGECQFTPPSLQLRMRPRSP